MYINKEIIAEIVTNYGAARTAVDTGSPESQIALFTFRINHLTEHLKAHKKDVSTRIGLLRLVGKRKRLLTYLQNTEIGRYRAIIKELGIRK